MTAPKGLRERKALVVEDTDSSRELIETFFQGFEIPCDCVDTAEQALELLDARSRSAAEDMYGVVLLDWQLPGIDGLTAAARIRASDRTHDLPIILMSAYVGKEEEARCHELGVNVFLSKPITPSSLYNAIIEARGQRAAAPLAALPSATEAEFSGTRVLLADDNETNQFVALEMLGRLGIELEIAANGREAVEMIASKPYAAVLMDVQMPVMDGLEATRRIRQQPAFRQLPIIAMTALAMKSDIDACLSAGMNDFVSKPIERDTLLKSLRREIQFHPSYCLDTVGRYGNNKTFFIPTEDLYLLAVLNSPLLWWHNWRFLPHMKDEALTPVGYLMETLPIAPPSDAGRTKTEPAVRRLIEITATHHTMRRTILDWLCVEHGIEKASLKLQSVTS